MNIKVGNTRLVKLTSFGDEPEIYAKLEWENPFGSVKDRAAYFMLSRAMTEGRLSSKKVMEATSGNTGVALAGMCRLLGLDFTAVVPERVSPDVKAKIEGLGGHVIVVKEGMYPDEGEGTSQAARYVKENSKGYFVPNQFENEANFEAHYVGTGPEIWRDVEVDYLVAGMGTGGTITGAGKYLSEKAAQVIGVEPKRSFRVPGLRNVEANGMSPLLERHFDVVDFVVKADSSAINLVTQVAEREGLFIGMSSAAALAGTLKLLKGRRGKAAVIFPDSGWNYITTYEKMGIKVNDHVTDPLKVAPLR
ncbi:PLP-dependent cysteine synthase family protein [Tardisphaera miroshnichenkoae]